MKSDKEKLQPIIKETILILSAEIAQKMNERYIELLEKILEQKIAEVNIETLKKGMPDLMEVILINALEIYINTIREAAETSIMEKNIVN